MTLHLRWQLNGFQRSEKVNQTILNCCFSCWIWICQYIFCWIVNNNITVLRRTAKQFGGRTVITNNIACISPLVVRACVLGWIIADERKPFWASFVQCKLFDCRFPVSFASTLTSTMSLRPFSWLYLCLHWVVRGSSPHYLVRGRGGSRCRAQVLRIKQQRPYAPLSKNGDFRIEP